MSNINIVEALDSSNPIKTIVYTIIICILVFMFAFFYSFKNLLVVCSVLDPQRIYLPKHYFDRIV